MIDEQRKIKITDFATLKREKQRLTILCNEKKQRLEEEVDYLKNNYPELGVKAILPFSENINDKIFNAASWTVKTAKKYTGKSPIGLFKAFSGNRSAVMKSAFIYAGSRIAKKIMGKKKRD